MGGSEFLQDVYAKHLPTDFGYPLRTPEPSSKLPESYQNEGLQIGDVGYVDHWGVFHVLFNIRYSSNHDLHRKRHLPTGFEPIKFDEEEININPEAIPSGQVLSSRHIVDKPLEQSDKRVLYRFVPSSSSGAILILPFGAVRHELSESENKTLRKIAVEHAERWCAAAGRNSIYLITGFHKARSWSLGSFQEAPPEGEILVKQLEPKEQDENARIHEWAPNFTTYWRAGPGGAENKRLSQTVFITGFTITVRSWLSIPDVEPLHPSSSAWFAFFRLPMVFLFGILRMLWKHVYPTGDNSRHEPIALLSQPFHPSAAINHHLLDKNPDVDVAVTHDRQWMGVLDMETMANEGVLNEDYVWEVLSDKCTSVVDNHTVWLESKSWDGTKGSQVASAVSSLSNHNASVAISGNAKKPCSTLQVFSLRTPSIDNPWIVISGIRADGVITGLTRLPVGFYVLFQFNGVQRRTKVRSILICESVIEWDDEIILSNDPSARVQLSFCAAFEFEPMLGNGTILCTANITAGNLVGSTSLVGFSSEARERCSSILITAERRYGPDFEAYSRRENANHRQEQPSAVAHETDLGHDALLRYYEHYKEDDLKNAIGHFECALRVCHADDECRPAALFNLATVTFHRFEVSGTDMAIAKSIALYRESLEMRRAPHPDRPATLLGLGQALLYCYRRQGRDESVADDLKKLMNEVKMICPEGSHWHRAARLVLETSKRIRAQYCFTLSDIDELIRDLDATARLPPEEYFDRPYRLENIGLALRRRFEMQGNHGWVADLDQAIVTQEDGIRLIHEHCPARAYCLSQLGVSLYTRFNLKKLGNIEDIRQAIAMLEEAVKLTPENHPDRALHLENLGVSLWARYKKLGGIEDIGRAIAMHEEALKLTSENHPDCAWYLDNLGGGLRARFDKQETRGYRTSHSMREEAVKLTPENHPDRAQHLENLGGSLRTRFKKLGDVEDIGRAIAMHEEGVKLTLENHPDCARHLDKLGRCLRARFKKLGDIAVIGRAIAMHEEALKLTPESHFDRAQRLENLGVSLWARFKKLGDIEDIERATVMDEEALKLTPKGHSDRARRLENLGGSLSARFKKLADIADIGRAIAMHEEALKLTPESHPDHARRLKNLGQSLYIRYNKLKDTRDIERALLREARISLLSQVVRDSDSGIFGWKSTE